MTPAERTYARPPGLCTCQACMHGSGKAAAVNRAPPATGVRKQPFIASESANARRPPTGAWTRARDGTNTIMDSDGAGQPDQQAGVIHSRASQCRLGRAAQGGSALSTGWAPESTWRATGGSGLARAHWNPE